MRQGNQNTFNRTQVPNPNYSGLQNNVIQTAQAEVNRLEREKARNINTIKSVNNIAQSIDTGLRTVDFIQKQKQKNALNSYQMNLKKRQVALSNEIGDGGAIDRLNLSATEKFALKNQKTEEEFAKQRSEINKLIAEKPTLSKLFQSGEDYDNTLNSMKLELEDTINKYNNELVAQQIKLNTQETISNINVTIDSFENQNNNGILTADTNSVIQDIQNSVNNNTITPEKGLELIGKAKQKYSEQEAQNDLNTIDIIISEYGNLAEAERLVRQKLEDFRDPEVKDNLYPYARDKLKIEQDYRKKLEKIQKTKKQAPVKKAIDTLYNTITLNTTPEQAQSQLKALDEYKNADNITKNQMESQMQTYYNQINNKPQDYLNKKGYDNYLDRMAKLTEEGKGNLSGFTENEASIFKASFEKNVYNPELNKSLTPIQNIDRFISEQEEVVGSKQNLLKESKIHLSGSDSLLVEARLKGLNIAEQLANTYNKNPDLIAKSEKNIDVYKKDYYDTARGEYTENLNPAIADKEAQGFAKISNATGIKIKDLVENFQETESYFTNDYINIIYDPTTITKRQLKNGINNIIQNVDEYVNQGIIEFENEKNLPLGLKYDITSNYEVTSTDGENFYITLVATNPKEPNVLPDFTVGKFNIKNLPTSVSNVENFEFNVKNASTPLSNSENFELFKQL